MQCLVHHQQPARRLKKKTHHTKMEWVRLQPAFIIAMSSYMYDLKKRTRIFVGDADPVLIPG